MRVGFRRTRLTASLTSEVKMNQVITTQVAQLNMFEMLPNALIGIEIGCVRQELLQPNKLRSLLCQKGFHLGAPMNGRTIPNFQQVGPHRAPQITQEEDTLPPRQRTVSGERIQLSVWGNTAHQRQMIVRVPALQNGAFPTRGPSADDARQQVKRRFISEYSTA